MEETRKLTLGEKLDLVDALHSGATLTGMSAARLLKGRLDWHVLSLVLDEWARNGIVSLIGHNRDGMCEYVWKEEERGSK